MAEHQQIPGLLRPGDWLAEHPEPGQAFAEYLDAHPVRKSEKLNTIPASGWTSLNSCGACCVDSFDVTVGRP